MELLKNGDNVYIEASPNLKVLAVTIDKPYKVHKVTQCVNPEGEPNGNYTFEIMDDEGKFKFCQLLGCSHLRYYQGFRYLGKGNWKISKAKAP